MKSEDIKDKLTISGNKLTIPGALIDRIGTAAKDEGDLSAPGMVIRLEGNGPPHRRDEIFPRAQAHTVGKDSVVQSASLENTKDSYGIRRATASRQSTANRLPCKALDKPITTGKATITGR